jgi:hypothetical protein
VSVRDVARLGLLGALWGAVEITLGAAMQAAHVPLRGALLTTIGITIALVGAAFVRRPGAAFAIGMVAAALRLVGLSGFAISSVAAIVIEAALAEACLAAFRYRIGAPAFCTAGAAAVLWDLAHPALGVLLLGGADWLGAFWRAAHKASAALHLPPASPFVLVAALALMRIGLGCLAGLAAWRLVRRLQARFGVDGA